MGYECYYRFYVRIKLEHYRGEPGTIPEHSRGIPGDIPEENYINLISFIYPDWWLLPVGIFLIGNN